MRPTTKINDPSRGKELEIHVHTFYTENVHIDMCNVFGKGTSLLNYATGTVGQIYSGDFTFFCLPKHFDWWSFVFCSWYCSFKYYRLVEFEVFLVVLMMRWWLVFIYYIDGSDEGVIISISWIWLDIIDKYRKNLERILSPKDN